MSRLLLKTFSSLIILVSPKDLLWIHFTLRSEVTSVNGNGNSIATENEIDLAGDYLVSFPPLLG
jgi:hypothetical protein